MDTSLKLALASTIALTACGGASTSNTPPSATMSAALAAYDASVAPPSSADFDKFAALNFDNVSLARPTVGAADYNGLLFLSTYDNPSDFNNGVSYADFGGDALLRADFSTNTITGEAKNFGRYSITASGDLKLEEAVNGQLTLGGGTITGDEFSGIYTGLLTNSVTNRTNNVNLNLNGAFGTDGTQNVAIGIAEGTAVVNGGGKVNETDLADAVVIGLNPSF